MKIQIPPKEIGYFDMGSARFYQKTKPNVIHRYFMRILLGFVWHDVGQ